jgi:protein-tyrosine-phosphatase
VSDPVKVLFVCTANICRSAYAQVRGESLMAGRPTIQLASAGTWGFDASPIDPPMGLQATARGADPSGFRSRRLTRVLVAEADIILTATSEHRTFILEDHPGALRKTFTLGQFAESIADADVHLHGTDLIAAARTNRVPPRPTTDIADPHRRGDEAAARCAQQIDDLLTAVLPRLAG